MLQHAFQSWKKKKQIATQVRWELFTQCAAMREATVPLCNSNLCNTPTTYTHGLQYLSWRELDNGVTIKGCYEQTRESLAVLTSCETTYGNFQRTRMLTVVWSPWLLTHPLVAPLVSERKQALRQYIWFPDYQPKPPFWAHVNWL